MRGIKKEDDVLLRHTCMLMTSALLAASSAGMASVTLIDADFDANTTGLYGTGQANGATIAGTSGTLNVSANGVSNGADCQHQFRP